MCAATLSLSDSDRQLDSLAYIESKTDAYIQNYIEHNENDKQHQNV